MAGWMTPPELTPPSSPSATITAPEGQIVAAFSDIIDSTNLWQLDQQLMLDAHTVFYSKVRALAPLYHGYEVKNLGDGFFHTFQSGRDSLRFCLALQKELAATRWSREIVEFRRAKDVERNIPTSNNRGLTVRMGIHFGSPFESHVDPISKRMDYHGNMVNVAARIMAQADGDEIAVSDAVIMELDDNDVGFDLGATVVVLNRVTTLEKVLAEMGETAFEVLRKGPADNGGRVRLKGVSTPYVVTLIRLKR
ncbi:adenylyl cyclase [Mollisia scopiformis]|uniref:Adenylyl cyclase n=1 Tax=Mollisia scopiformis TaxID=149040 RepID=A0A194XXE0_MOLSC|nr:adenylyl cyclase [Mollisia scopiformis]KUJ24457.1 adenylyl cyclase [Mollisia scopiformis]